MKVRTESGAVAFRNRDLVFYLTMISILWTVLFWLSAVLVPVAAVITQALFQDSQGGWRALLDPTVLSVVRLTLWQVFWSTLWSGTLGLLLGLWIGSFLANLPRSRAHALLVVPFGVPTSVVGIAWVTWLGRTGVFAYWGFHSEWIYSLKAVILAHVFLNVPWVAYLVSQARKDLPHSLLEAAKTLGADRKCQFRYVVWPHVSSVFWGACAQVSSLCTMSFSLVLGLGGGPPVQTLETEIYERLRYGLLDISGALACGVWELALTLVPWVLVLYFYSKHKKFNFNQPHKQVRRLRHHATLWGLGGFFVIPYLVIFNGQTPATLLRVVLDPDSRLQVLMALDVSVRLAVAASLGCVLTVVAALMTLNWLKKCKFKSLESIMNLLLKLPSGVSVLVLGLGVWIAYSRWVDPFEGSFLVVLGLQMTLFFPVAFRLLSPISESHSTLELEGAVLLGASRFQAFWIIEWPRWKGPLFASLAAVAGGGLGEVGAVSLFYSERLISMPLLLSRWMGQYRFAEAQAVGGLLLLLSFALMLIAFELGELGELGRLVPRRQVEVTL